MIRVLHFVSTPSIGSGVMSVIMNYYRYMDHSKIQFDFLCFIPCKDSYEKEINALGGNVFFITKPKISLNTFYELSLFFKENSSNYICFHNHEVYMSFFLQPLTKYYQIPNFVVHAHASKYSDKTLNAIRNRILCLPLYFMKTDKYQTFNKFACSQMAGKFLFKKEHDLFILHNAIDLKKYQFNSKKREELRQELDLKDNFVIGHIGRFNTQKNHCFLLEVFKKVLFQCPNAKLLLIGTGSLKDTIFKQAEKDFPKNTILFIENNTNVNDLLNIMDCFVLPSLYEGLPVSAIEAQANGLPCILSSKITLEVKINNNVIFESIDLRNSITLWSNHILKFNQRQEIKDKKWNTYDVSISKKYLENFYLLLKQ